MTEENDFYKIMWDQKAKGEIIEHNDPLVAVASLRADMLVTQAIQVTKFIQQDTSYNGVRIDTVNGLVAQATNGTTILTSQTILNATEGIKIQKNIGTFNVPIWDNQFSVDVETGDIYYAGKLTSPNGTLGSISGGKLQDVNGTKTVIDLDGGTMRFGLSDANYKLKYDGTDLHFGSGSIVWDNLDPVTQENLTGATGVSFRAMGVWSGATSYVNDTLYTDIVTDGASSYYCKVSNISQPVTNTTYWGNLASQGIQGVQGPIGSIGNTGISYRNLGAWMVGSAYVNDSSYIDTVNYNGSLYACEVSNTGQTPTNTAYWTLIVVKGDTGTTGSQGIQGVTGTTGSDGITYYTWLKYASNSGGANMSDLPTTLPASSINLWYLVGSEANYDFLTILLDGVQKARVSGIGVWQNLIINGLAPGNHTLTFIYSTDTSTESNGNFGAIDDVTLIQGSATTLEDFEDDAFAFTLNGDWARSATYKHSGLYSLVSRAIGVSSSSTETLVFNVPSMLHYMGIAYNKLTPTKSTIASDYSWSLIKGDTGLTGPILDWVSEWDGQKVLINGTSIVTPKLFAGINGGTSASPTLTGIAIGRDVLGGTNATIGLIAYNANVPTVQINTNGSAQFGVGANAVTISTAGVVAIPGALIAGTINGVTLTLGGSGNASGLLTIKDASGATVVTGDNNGIVVTKGVISGSSFKALGLIEVSSNVFNAATDHGMRFGGTVGGYDPYSSLKFYQGTVGTSTSYMNILVSQGKLNLYSNEVNIYSNLNVTGITTSTGGFTGLGRKTAYSWNGTIAAGGGVNISHNLNWYPIIKFSGPLGYLLTRNDNTINQIIVWNSSGSDWTGYVDFY